MTMRRINVQRHHRTVIGACTAAVVIAGGLALASAVQRARTAAFRSSDL